MGKKHILLVSFVLLVVYAEHGNAEGRTGTWISDSDPGQFDMTEALVRLNSRLLMSMRGINVRSEPESDMRFDLADRGIRFSSRYNKRDGAGRFAYFVDVANRKYGIRASAGYFMPDIAMGMVFSGHNMTYPFSSGFPLRRYRHLVRRSSFYGCSVRGVALSAKVKRLFLMAFSGIAGKWSANKYVMDEGRLGGLRIETSSARMRSGLTFSFDSGLRSAGTDFRIDRESSSVACELVGCSMDRISGMTGVRWKNRQGSVGIIIFCIDLDMDIEMGNIPGGREGYVASRRGYSLTASRRMKKSIIGRIAVGQTSYGNSDRLDWKNSCRAEVALRSFGFRISAGYVANSTNSLSLMPVPQEGSLSESIRRSLNFLASKEFGRTARMRLSVRYPFMEENSGLILTQSFRVADQKRKNVIDLSYSWHQTFLGNPSFYSYQPTLIGEYPWKYFDGNGLYWVITASRKMRGSTLSLKSTGGSQRQIGMDIQIRYDF